MKDTLSFVLLHVCSIMYIVKKQLLDFALRHFIPVYLPSTARLSNLASRWIWGDCFFPP